MTFPDKLSFTKGEKTAEIICAAMFAVFFAAYITLIAVGYLTGASIIMIVISGVMYTAWTTCSVYPQWTNLVSKPEDVSENKLHKLRRSCLVADHLFLILIFAITVIARV